MTPRLFVPRLFQVWGWARTLIYDCTAGLVLAAAAVFILRATPGYSTLEKLPALLVPAAWMAITWRLYALRRSYANRILWVTRQGVSVVPDAAKDWLATRRTRLEDEIDAAVHFWEAHYFEFDIIADFINGCALEVAVQDGPIIVARHGIEAKALYWPKRICVTLPTAALSWSKADPRSQFTKQYEAEFFALIRHECGHAALDAMGVPGVSHHETMKQAGWVDA